LVDIVSILGVTVSTAKRQSRSLLCQRVFELIHMICVPLHHARPIGPVLRQLVGAPNLVILTARELGLDVTACVSNKMDCPAYASASPGLTSCAQSDWLAEGRDRPPRFLDRVIRRSSSLNQGAKCALISMDSTIRSNLSVGLPLDLVLVRRDTLRVARHVSIGEDNEYFASLRRTWSEALRHAFAQLPEPDWLQHGAETGRRLSRDAAESS
jgi:hypothetical protein